MFEYHQEKIELARVQAGIQGWINHARYGDTWGLRQAILSKIIL